MPTLKIAHGLYTWKITLENGEERTVFGSTLGTTIAGVLPSPVIKAERGVALDPIMGNADAPLLILMQPTESAIDGPPFTLAARGRGFRPDSIIVFNDRPRSTTFVSSTELRTSINPPGEPPITEPIGVPVRIQNQNDNGTRASAAEREGSSSNTLQFTITPGTPGRREARREEVATGLQPDTPNVRARAVSVKTAGARNA